MSDKLRSDVDFRFDKGYFRDYSSVEPIQLYRFFERESDAKRITEECRFGDEILLLYCVSGNAILATKNERIPFRSGGLIVARVDDECYVESSTEESDIHYIGITLSLFDRVSPHSLQVDLYRYYRDATFPLCAEECDDLYVFFSALIDEFTLSSHQTHLLIRGILYQILSMSYRYFNRTYNRGILDETSLQAVGHTVYAIIRYIDEHLYSMDHLTGMAQDLGYSYNYLSHLFRKKTGMTIQMYVSRKKIEKSVELLSQQQMSITEVASLLNYDCIQSFSKAFKRAMKMSPTEYRALHVGDTEE